MALLSLVCWLHFQAGDKILTAPRTTVPELQVSRRKRSPFLYLFLRRGKLRFPSPQSLVCSHWPELDHFPIPKPITVKEERVTGLTRINQNLRTPGTGGGSLSHLCRRVDTGKNRFPWEGGKNPQQHLLQREKRGGWQPRLE